MKNKQKAAMFGLDARIALAIFGALSVITGAALYKVIDHVKITAMASDIIEMGKAFEQFYLDTGSLLVPENPSNPNDAHFYNMRSSGLLINQTSIKGWKGPYINYGTYPPTPEHLGYPKTNAPFSFMILREGANTGITDWYNSSNLCLSGISICYMWINITGFKNEDIVKKLDTVLDNGDGKAAGSLRWWKMYPSPYFWGVQYKYMPIRNPNG